MGESRTPNHRSLLRRDDGLGARRSCGARPCGRVGPWRWSGPRSGGRCCARRSCRCRRRRWSGRGATTRRLDRNHHRRACFEVPDCRIGTLRRLIGIEPEIIQCAPANRVGVLVLCKRFSVPGYGIGSLSNSPRRAAISLVVKRAVICPTRVLRRRVKSDVTDVNTCS